MASPIPPRRAPDPGLRVVCVGDCGVDRYVNLGVDRAGGITLNVAINARACFEPADVVAIVTALGLDAEARVVLEAIAPRALECRVARLAGRTPVQEIERQPTGERRFVRYEAGVLPRYRPGPRERDLIAGADLLVTNVYRQVLPFFDAVMAIPSRGLRFVDFLDLSDWEDGPSVVQRYIDRFDIAQFGLRVDDAPLLARLERLARARGKLFVVTLGPAGSMALGGPTRVRCAADPVDSVVDTTGAGDAFAAGFLACYCRSRKVPESLRAGSRRAGRVIRRLGAF